jgi:hypothetical protein
VDGLLAQFDEVLEFEKIFRKVPTRRKLTKADEISSLGPGPGHCIQHFGQVLAEITNMVVQLSERNPHNFLEISENVARN